MNSRVTLIGLAAISLLFIASCDVEKQMDTMIDNPSFAEPLFAKFMARNDYQAKAIDTILRDPAMRQQLMEQLAANGEYARAAVEQLMNNPDTREMMGQLLVNQPGTIKAP
jgi:hypothetical protein